jgi:hypothetical protein
VLFRSEGLHRAHRAGLGLLRAGRALRGGAAVDAPAAALELAEALAALRRHGPAAAGEARRAYHPVGALRLWGLCCEPVVGPDGAENGLLTWMIDAQGRLCATADLRPGPATRAAAVYGQGVQLGGSALSHAALSRAGLFVRDARRSDDGRLGAGQGTAAVRADGAPWLEGPAGPRFALDPAAQAEAEPGGLLFVHLEVLGVDGDQPLGRLRGGAEVELEPPPTAAGRENLHQLLRAPGLCLPTIGRARPGPRPRLRLLAVSAGPALGWPAAWEGRVNLGWERLQSAHLGAVAAAPRALDRAPPPPDPLAAVRVRLAALVEQGIGALPPSAVGALQAEARALRAAGLPTVADALLAVLRARFDPAEPLARTLRRLALAEAAALARTAALGAGAP